MEDIRDLDLACCFGVFRRVSRKIPRYERFRKRVVQEVLVCGSGFSHASTLQVLGTLTMFHHFP